MAKLNTTTVYGDHTVTGSLKIKEGKLKIGDVFVTASASDLNKLIGYTGSVTELNYLKSLYDTGVTATEFDYLDGVTSSIQSQLNSKFNITGGTVTGNVVIGTGVSNTAKLAFNISNSGSPQIEFSDTGGDVSFAIGVDDGDNTFKIHGSASNTMPALYNLATPLFEVNPDGHIYNSGYTVYTTNDSASGNTASKLVIRDSSGNFSAGTITAALTGNASTATKLATARTIDITGDITATAVAFDGSANISISASVNDDSHNHIISNVDGLQAALDLKAPLASPALTGTPTAPTAASATNTTQIATTAFVKTAISNLVDSSPAALDTLNELAAALGDDPDFASTVSTSLGEKVAKTSVQALHATDALRISGQTVYLYKGDGTSENVVIPSTNITVSHAASSVAVNSSTGTDDTIDAATTTTAGVMTSADKTKLDGIATGANNYTLLPATSSVLGGVKIGYTESGKNYPVELADNKMFVNVPWTDTNTTYSTASSTTLGLVKIGYVENEKNYPVELSEGKMYVNVPWVDTNTNTTYTAGKGLNLSGTEFSLKVATSSALGGVISGAHSTVDASGNVSVNDNSHTHTSANISDATSTNSPSMIVKRDGSGDFAAGAITAESLILSDTTHASNTGVIYKGSEAFIHNFNYGNNGTVTTAGYNTFIGEDAGNFTMGSTATSLDHSSYNTGIGYASLYNNTTGASNTGAGYHSLHCNTTGSYNTGIGRESLYFNTTGYYNAGIGSASLYNNTTGSYNIGVGHVSLYSNTTGSYNTGMGRTSLYSNTTGYRNTGLGHSSLYSNTTGYDNTGIGYDSLYCNTTGSSNTGIGYESGRYLANGFSPNETSNNSIYLGAYTKALADGDTNEIVIGYEATGHGSNSVTIGNDSVLRTYLSGDVYTDSIVIASTTYTDSIVIESTSDVSATSTDNPLQIGNSASENLVLDSNQVLCRDGAGGFNTLYLNSDGEINGPVYVGPLTVKGQVTAESFNAVSSIIYKKDIEPFSDKALDIIDDINIVNFRYKEEDSNNDYLHIGFIAEDTPDCITGHYHNSMDTGNNIGLLLKAVQELKAEIDLLKIENIELKEKLNA